MSACHDVAFHLGRHYGQKDDARFEGIAAAKAITRLYGASRLFVNFFQPSFKLAAKHREGAQVSKRYHPPQTPCDRLLLEESMPDAAKVKLREIASTLDPLKLLEEMRAVQAHLAALADGETPPAATPEPPILPRSWLASRAHGELARYDRHSP